MDCLNAVIIEGEVVYWYKNEIVLKNTNRFGVSYVYAEFRGKKLLHSLGDLFGKTLRIVGALVNSRVVVEHAEFKPEEVAE